MRRRIRAWIERLFNSHIQGCTVLRVAEARRITPHMLRISFVGRNLGAFATDENLHVKLLLPPGGAPRDRWLTAGRDGRSRLRGKGVEPVFRKYTIRAIDVEAGRLDIDFVLHEDGGPGATWAAAARPGDVVGVTGPGGRGILPADWYLLAGDETAVPAIGRILESLPLDARGLALIEIGGPDEEQALTRPDGVELRWLHRQEAPSGSTKLLSDAVEAAQWPDDGRTVFVWVAAEFAAIQAIRRYLRRTRKLSRHEQMAVAYWRWDMPETKNRE